MLFKLKLAVNQIQQKELIITKIKKKCVLRSFDYYNIYDDNLSDPDNVEFTLQGKIGDQDENHWRNESLLNPNKTHHIYLYRVTPINSKKKNIHGMVNMKLLVNTINNI